MDFKINLQLFAEAEKTEKATPKKRRDAREEGQVVQSKEVNSVFILLAAILGLKIFGKHVVFTIMHFMDYLYGDFSNIDKMFTDSNLRVGFLKLLNVFFRATIPIVLISFFVGLLVTYMQVGFLFTTKPLKVKFSRINPIEGFKRIFSKRSIMELAKSILKIFFVGYVAYSYASKNIGQVVNYPGMEPKQILKSFSKLAFGFSIRIIGVLMVLAILDYLYQWRDYEKNLMMTKQELKEEFKQTEGDPLIKSRIREKQRKIAMNRMMQDVPKADVIITNPTHLAIAIKYDKDLYIAPYLLAKGANVVAENIKRVAKKNSIPIVENKPLAQVLYSTVDIGELIPEELYEAVAEILAYAYSLKDE